MLLQRHHPTTEEKTQERILQAAGHLFAEQGYERTTTKQLAEAAGIAEGTLFRHFESKKAILAEVIHQGWDVLLSDLTVALCEVSDYRDLAALLRHRLQDIQKHDDLLRVCLMQTPFHPDLQDLFQKERIQQMLDVLEAFIQTGIDRGRYRPLNARLVARVLLGTLMGSSWVGDTLLCDQNDPITQQAMADTLADILLNGLLLPADMSA